MRSVRIQPGAALDATLAGSVLTRDLSVGGEAWSKGRRLTSDDLARLAAGPVEARGAWAGTGRDPGSVTLLIPGPDDLHEDEAARRLASVVAGSGVELRGPSESRMDLVARHDGVLRVRVNRMERIDRIDGLSVFSALDGQVVSAGTLVASVKTGPHLVVGGTWSSRRRWSESAVRPSSMSGPSARCASARWCVRRCLRRPGGGSSRVSRRA